MLLSLNGKAENTMLCNFPISTTYIQTGQPYSQVHPILNTEWFSSHHCRSVSVHECVIRHFHNTYYWVCHMVKKEKSSIKNNEAHLLKAVGKNVATVVYRKISKLVLNYSHLITHLPYSLVHTNNIRLCWG